MDDQPGLSEGDVPVYRTVVGVAKHVRHYELQEPSRIEIYRPMLQANDTWGFSPFLITKTATDPTSLRRRSGTKSRRWTPTNPFCWSGR